MFSANSIILWMIATGIFFLIVEFLYTRRGHTTLDLADVSYKQAVAIGFIQALSLIPGVSRSGSTILGGMLLGMKRELEVSGQVIYQVLPTAENNYHQGIGVQFKDPNPADLGLLKDYISFALLNGQKGIEDPKSFEKQVIPSAPMLGMALRFS